MLSSTCKFFQQVEMRNERLLELLQSPISQKAVKYYEDEVKLLQKTYHWSIANEAIKNLRKPTTLQQYMECFIRSNSDDELPTILVDIKKRSVIDYNLVLLWCIDTSVNWALPKALSRFLDEFKSFKATEQLPDLEKYKVKSFLSGLISSSNNTMNKPFDSSKYDECISVLIDHHPHKAFKYFAHHEHLEYHYYNTALFGVCRDLESSELFEKQSRKPKIIKLLCNKKFMDVDLHLESKDSLKQNYPILAKLTESESDKLLDTCRNIHQHQKTSGTRTTNTIYAERVVKEMLHEGSRSI